MKDMELIQELEKTYGYNEPILLNEIKIADMNEVY
ncbi:MAG: hypothetical protein K0R09_2573, partial [Clostridiales bacterium]|nr:hypothetical protein [Clostridiales bacterium]